LPGQRPTGHPLSYSLFGPRFLRAFFASTAWSQEVGNRLLNLAGRDLSHAASHSRGLYRFRLVGHNTDGRSPRVVRDGGEGLAGSWASQGQKSGRGSGGLSLPGPGRANLCERVRRLMVSEREPDNIWPPIQPSWRTRLGIAGAILAWVLALIPGILAHSSYSRWRRGLAPAPTFAWVLGAGMLGLIAFAVARNAFLSPSPYTFGFSALFVGSLALWLFGARRKALGIPFEVISGVAPSLPLCS
jgi:hypothetical protein